jgi:hypothetical protein
MMLSLHFPWLIWIIKESGQHINLLLRVRMFGELKNLTPAEGYMLKVANEGNLKYPESARVTMQFKITAKGDTLDFNTSDYEHSGSVTARVFIMATFCRYRVRSF